MVDLIGFSSILLILFITFFRLDWISTSNLRVIAAFASCIVLLKLFDWLRLFEDVAFYVLLVEETIYDIRHFVMLLLTTLMMFGVPLIMLQPNGDVGKDLVEDTFGYWLIDLVYNQYLLALGEFGVDNFSDHPQAPIVFAFFVLATMISQITMLNMLIAIMGDTYAKVTENKDINSTKMKLAILSELSVMLPRRDDEEK